MNKTWADLLAKNEATSDGISYEALPPSQSLPSCMLALAGVLACLLIAGCAVGPDFKKPAAPDVSDYTRHPLSTTVASAQRRRRRSAALCQGKRHLRRLVDFVSFQAAQ